MDVLTKIDGVEFSETWATRREVDVDGELLTIISRDMLIRNKKASARLQDLADVERLERGGEE